MNAKNEEIRIVLACCIAEVIRIYAPTAPYKESDLKVKKTKFSFYFSDIHFFLGQKIFKLFLKELAEIESNKGNKYYSELLQQLVRVKAFLLLIDLDMQLVRQTFTQFLQIPV